MTLQQFNSFSQCVYSLWSVNLCFSSACISVEVSLQLVDGAPHKNFPHSSICGLTRMSHPSKENILKECHRIVIFSDRNRATIPNRKQNFRRHFFIKSFCLRHVHKQCTLVRPHQHCCRTRVKEYTRVLILLFLYVNLYTGILYQKMCTVFINVPRESFFEKY